MCLVGVVVRRYIDFLILLIPTPYVSAFSEGSTFCSFFCFSFLFQYIFIINFIIFRHSSIIITCCIMHYNYIQNRGHVCHTHIKGYAMGRIYRFPQKNAAATIYFSANAIYSRVATIRSAAFIQGNTVSVVEPSLVSKREL